MSVREREERGESAEDTRAAALREFGNVGLVNETTREIWGYARIEQLCQDVLYGMRMMRRSPAFTAVAVLTLALGIGANAAIFSVVNAVLLRPLPFEKPDRLVTIFHTPPQESFPGVPTFAVSPANFLDWRDQNRAFEGMSAFGLAATRSRARGTPRPFEWLL